MGRGRGQSAGLTREDIADAAVAVMDRAGLDAVTIRSVAGRLRVHPSALYNHVRDKDDLLDVMTTRCFERLPALDPGDTRPAADQLREVFRAWRDLCAQHPGLLPMFGRGMHEWRVVEDVQALLGRCGLDSATITSVFVALITVTIGSALITSELDKGGGETELRRRLVEQIDALPLDDYPTVRDRAATLQHSKSLDDHFDEQLTLVLAPLLGRDGADRDQSLA